MVNCVVFSSDGRRLAMAGGKTLQPDFPGDVTVWDATTGERLLDCQGHKEMATAVAFSPPSGANLFVWHAIRLNDRGGLRRGELHVQVFGEYGGEILAHCAGHLDSPVGVKLDGRARLERGDTERRGCLASRRLAELPERGALSRRIS
jgi:hypothetical protein